MLTKITVYNPVLDIDPLVWNILDRPETDLFEVRNIDGLDAVKANVNTTPLGSVDKEAFTGSNFGKRNLVITLGLVPDWLDWDYSKLRRLLAKYFMPKLQTHLVLETTEFLPVEIFGYVESNEQNIFSKDPEHQISIICPEPDFISVDPIVLNGLTMTSEEFLTIDYEGNLDTGFTLKVNNSVAPNPSLFSVDFTLPQHETFHVDYGSNLPLDSSHYFMMSSLPGQKFVKIIALDEINLLNYVAGDSTWLALRPGVNHIRIFGNHGVQEWELTYFEHFGSL